MLLIGIAASIVFALVAVYVAWARHRDFVSRRAWVARQNTKALANDAALFDKRAHGD